MRRYSIKEAFYSLQGEGYHSGRAAVFVRFSGCNLWNGLSRVNAICKFCDTDFVGSDGLNGGKYSADEIAELIKRLWVDKGETPFIVFTGGEPLLQVDADLVGKMKKEKFYIAVETNGTIDCPEGIDWVCVSPKIGSELKVIHGDELKFVYPQEESPTQFEHLDFSHFFLQPKYDQDRDNSQITLNYCLKNPKWKLSLQTHKVLNIL